MKQIQCLRRGDEVVAVIEGRDVDAAWLADALPRTVGKIRRRGDNIEVTFSRDGTETTGTYTRKAHLAVMA